MTAGGYSGGRFRAAVLQYALGRGVNALASVALFVLLARALPVRDYAAYVTLWALLELLLAVGNLGTEWVTATEVPRLRQGQAWALLRRLVASALGVQALAFGSLGLLLALAGPQLAHLAGWSLPVEVWPWLGLHLLAEGLGRSLRDQLLSSLLLQGVAQAVQLLRNLVVLLGVAWAMQESAGLGILSIVPLETLASAGGMLLALANLCWHLRHRGAPAGDVAAPDGAVLRRMALHAWVGSLASLLVSPQLLVLLAARFLGSEATALLGFARNLAEQVRRFMPIEFGFIILRTFLVTRFQDRSQLAALVDRSQVAWKLNLALLLPLGLVAALWGDRLATLVGGAKFQAAGPLLVAWLVWVVAWSHHRLSDLWAHLLSRSAAVGRSSLALAALPILLGVTLAAQQALAAVLLLAVGECLYALRVAALALRGELAYPWAQLRAPSWAVGLVLGAVTGWLWRAAQWPWLLGAAAVLVVMWCWLGTSRALGREDLARWRPKQAAGG